MSLYRRLALVLALACVPAIVWATTAGPSSGGTFADDSAVGTVAWTNPGNAAASDNTRANAACATATTHYLKATNFGFAIPAGATIGGITAEIEHNKGPMAGYTENRISIVKADGTIGTTNKSTGATGPLADADTYVTYGGSADLWDETWTSTSINDSDFGVVFSVTGTAASSQAQVDHIRITVTYTAAVSGRSGPLLTGVGKPVSQTRSARKTTSAL